MGNGTFSPASDNEWVSEPREGGQLMVIECHGFVLKGSQKEPSRALRSSRTRRTPSRASVSVPFS